jgi:hypothetical protein
VGEGPFKRRDSSVTFSAMEWVKFDQRYSCDSNRSAFERDTYEVDLIQACGPLDDVHRPLGVSRAECELTDIDILAQSVTLRPAR